ncbi:hypothetical protein IV203_023551 [Nitzschia inconspicua]|uniref:Uncharacterized protein n=1 Tax=Nitzschia inconspicua TaxID=303405 RepID=A0A9K3KEL1_9STRA|nr:hypothetical protein IV203_023551 [Nitzschia inconspicua]
MVPSCNLFVSIALLCFAVSLHVVLITPTLMTATTTERLLSYENLKTRIPTMELKTIISAPHAENNNSITRNDTDIAVFYNLFVDPQANETEIARVKKLVNEQLTLKQSWHKVYVNSIGLEVDSMFDNISDATLLKHFPEGSEIITLRSIYDYCQKYPTRKAIYLHSKGSYHPEPENEVLRQFLTRGALSEAAANASPSQCNVVSSRFSPTPHPHTSGNMWLAHCNYIKDLIPPNEFTGRMARVRRLTQSSKPSCIGFRRYAAEHWVHSHPSVKPCDLYTDTAFQWGYEGLTDTSGTKDGDFELKAAPRLTWNATDIGCMDNFGRQLKHRLAEYKFLYGILPDSSWWGWKLWREELQVLFNDTIPSINDESIRFVPMENPKW